MGNVVIVICGVLTALLGVAALMSCFLAARVFLTEKDDLTQKKLHWLLIFVIVFFVVSVSYFLLSYIMLFS